MNGDQLKELVNRNLIDALGTRSVREVTVAAGIGDGNQRYFNSCVDLSLTKLDELAKALCVTPMSLVSKDGPRKRRKDANYDSTHALRYCLRYNEDIVKAWESREDKMKLYEATMDEPRKKTHRISFLALAAEVLGLSPTEILSFR